MSKNKSNKSTPSKNEVAPFLSIHKITKSPIFYSLLPILLFTVVTFILRWRLLDIPLERDEGGFAYMGYTWIHGTPLFSDYVDVKPPLIYVLYGIFEVVFGATPKGIHTGLFIFNLGFTITFFYFIRNKYSFGTALIAALSFILLSSLPNVFGFAAHATQLLLWPALAGIWITVKALERSKPILLVPAGVLLGLAFLIKQQAIGFMLFAGIFLMYITLFKEKNWKHCIIYGFILTLSAILPYALCLLWFYLSGNLNHFWYWTYTWPSQFAATQTGNFDIFKLMYGIVTKNIELLWYIGIIGIILCFFDTWNTEKKIFALFLLIFGFMSLSVGFHYYPHYFVVLLPAISLGVGLAFHLTFRILIRFSVKEYVSIPTLMLFFLIIFYIAYKPNKNYYTKTKKQDIVRQVYGQNPFQEAVVLAHKIKSLSQPGDSILVLGSEPELLFYTKLPSISQHMHYYQLVDGGHQNDSLQTELIRKVDQSKPRFLVFARVSMSWLVRDPSNKLFQWIDQITSQSYELIGIIKIYPDRPSEYLWDTEMSPQQIGNGNEVLLFELKK